MAAEDVSLSTSLRKAFTRGWPTWPHAIQLSADFQVYADEMGLQDPPIIIANAGEASVKVATDTDTDTFTQIYTQFEDSLINLIYASNQIESAGSSREITARLCRFIFRGEPTPDLNLEEGSSEYEEYVSYLGSAHRKTDKKEVIRSRREVTQHARAFLFLINAVVFDGRDLTEELILKTHAILCENLDDEDGDVTPGQYRTTRVAVRYSKPGEEKSKKSKARECLRPAAVPIYMRNFVSHLDKELSAAEDNRVIDPYTTAARYHQQFIMIHPFGDGNGRTVRIIMNVLLLKYAGHVCVFGGDTGVKEKEEYLEIVRRAAGVFHEEDMEVEFERQTCHGEFARFVLRMSRVGGLEWLGRWAT